MQIARKIAVGVLWFLGVSGLVGAVPLLLFPHGKPWGFMSQSLLRYSPFHSYLIPGIILFIANGCLCMLVLYATQRRWTGYGWLVAFQGCVAAGWIVVEVIMLRTLSWAHLLYFAVGLGLIVSGLALTRDTSAGHEKSPKSWLLRGQPRAAAAAEM
jgi:hypothetical protein